ncbi:endonuclease/exonuclease/phosphatase family protein [Streptomyces sp. PmtG]
MVLALLAGLLTVTVVGAAAPPAHASNSDRRILAWNMQGGGDEDGPAAKWQTLFNLMRDRRVDMATLQESGVAPRGATHLRNVAATMTHARPEPITEVEVHRYGGTGTRPQFYLYRIAWDDGGHRVNQAILMRQLADEVLLVPRRGDGLRPMLGVRLGDDLVFTIHAGANNGPDAAAQAEDAWNYAQGRNLNLVVAGDFNRIPEDLDVPEGMYPENTGEATHRSGRELDYMLTNEDRPSPPSVVRVVNSDHEPVLFPTPLRAAAGAVHTLSHRNDSRYVMPATVADYGFLFESDDTKPAADAFFIEVPIRKGAVRARSSGDEYTLLMRT